MTAAGRQAPVAPGAATVPVGAGVRGAVASRTPDEDLTVLRALVLGIVQGITEFLPISSSAHLVLVPYFAGWPKPGLAFDVALHLGTLVAVLWVFRSDLAAMVRSVYAAPSVERERGRRLIWLLAIGSLPVAVAGVVFEPLVEQAFTEPLWTAGFLFVTASVLLVAERLATRPAGAGVTVAAEETTGEMEVRTVASVGLGDAIVVGFAQAAALLPGISRSGATIGAGLLRGVDRHTAARFSFLLSIPAIAGAIAVQVPDLGATRVPLSEVAVGVLAAFVAGLWAIRFLLRIITTRGLTGFAAYVTALAIVVFAVDAL